MTNTTSGDGAGGSRVGLGILAFVFVTAGVLHFVAPEAYMAIMPPWLPWHRELVLLSGAAEIAGGVGVLLPRWRRASGWGLVLLLVAVFPANLHMALEAETFAPIPAWGLWLRLPIQGLLIAWVWKTTGLGRDSGPGGSASGAG